MEHTFRLLVLALLLICIFNSAFGSFGLTLTSQQALDQLHKLTFTEHERTFHFYTSSRGRTIRDGNTVVTNAKAKRRQSSKVCRSMRTQQILSRKQYKLCRKDPGMAHTLVTAYKDMYQQCITNFQHERWNCRDQSARIRILTKDFREKGFLESLTSAGLAVTISRACDQGELVTCPCSNQSPPTPTLQGCDSSLKYGQTMAKRFLRVKEPLNQQTLHRYSHAVSLHNRNLGIKLVGKLAKKQCKCHGASTSCTIKTCWSQTASLDTVGAALKKSYDDAKQVHEYRSDHNTWRISEKMPNKLSLASNRIYPTDNRKVNPLDMVYIDASPDFCTPSLYGPGTAGRECNLTNDTCSVLCCGRGYSSVLVEVISRCKCIPKWCCDVTCDQCIRTETRLQCN